MAKIVDGIIVIDGCNDPNCPGNNHRNCQKMDDASTSTFSNPLGQEQQDQDQDQSNPNPNATSSTTTSTPDSGSDKENQISDPSTRINYELLETIIDNCNSFTVNSVKNCFGILVELINGFQYVCVYYDKMAFCFSAEEILSLDNKVLNKHFQIQERLRVIKDNQFKDKVILYLRLLKELLEEEKEEFIRFNNKNYRMILSLGTLEDTNLFINRIKNLLRNGRYLKYHPMTWFERLCALFEDLNRLSNESTIKFSIHPFTKPEFNEYPRFKRFRLLNLDYDDFSF